MAAPVDIEFIRDLFAAFGPVTVRRMFGGAGIAADGATFAIAFDGVVYLKTDPALAAELAQEGSGPFVYPYSKGRMPVRKGPSSFWRLPERLYDDPDELALWARRALAVARAKGAKPKRATASRRRKPAAAVRKKTKVRKKRR